MYWPDMPPNRRTILHRLRTHPIQKQEKNIQETKKIRYFNTLYLIHLTLIRFITFIRLKSQIQFNFQFYFNQNSKTL